MPNLVGMLHDKLSHRMTVPDVAEYLGISRRQGYYLIAKRIIPSVHHSPGCIRVKKEDVIDYENQRVVKKITPTAGK
tara:strand:- start:363 stop:593 length:231 start_codon:yes stop_codon:yes gene_type:complete